MSTAPRFDDSRETLKDVAEQLSRTLAGFAAKLETSAGTQETPPSDPEASAEEPEP